MKGYIYTMYAGADPGVGWRLTDPLFARVPTLGACVPNIRRVVLPGDFIFTVSGRAPAVRQYVVGGFRVAEKISALAAFHRFPENRLHKAPDGTVVGNIVVNGRGDHHALDMHGSFERRIENYIVGRDPLVLATAREVQQARDETIEVLSDIFTVRHARTVGEVLGRWRRLDDTQIERLLRWMRAVKAKHN